MNRKLIIERAKRIKYDYRYGNVEYKVGQILMALDGYKSRNTWSGTLDLLCEEFMMFAEKMDFIYNCKIPGSRNKVFYIIKKYFIKTNLINNE